jgi:serine/threonine protein kinase
MRAVGEHENLVCLHDTYETPRSYVLVLDLADGGALFDRVVDEGKLSEKEASGYILQVLDAILHMHRRKVVHGDIKPENLLLTSEDPNASIKICDFGMARFMDAKEGMVLNQNTGTMDYWSPEIVKNGQCGHGIDMWALGVVTYIMLCGSNPFDPRGSATDAEILTK